MALLVPILIGYLMEASLLKLANKNSQLLHENSLHYLMKIGPKYPQEFKTLMSQTMDLRNRLETAIKEQAQMQHLKLQDRPQLKEGSSVRLQLSVPSIKLKTDFSNFS